MSQIEKTLNRTAMLIGIGVPILKQLGSLFIPERKSRAILYEKDPDSCKEMQAIINKMAQDYQSLAMRNDFLENENSELRRKIHGENFKIKLDKKSKENARLLEQKNNMKMEIKNQEKTIESLRKTLDETEKCHNSAINDLEEMKTCKICSELYDEETRQSVKLKCPHILCRACADALPEKKCPFCRQKFFKNQVKRVILEF